MDVKIESSYFVEMAARTLDVLESFDSYEDELTIQQVATRAAIPYTSALRLLHTLKKRGYVIRREGKKYVRTPARKRFRIGYAALDQRMKFSEELSHSIVSNARRSAVDLIMKDNELCPQEALANADFLIEEKVDLLINHQFHETAAHIISTKCHEANIPVIAINFSQPGAYYFGGNNYLAGYMAGDYLCEFAKKEWQGKVDKVVIMRAKGMGSTQEVRMTGTCDSLKKGLRRLRNGQIVDAEPGITVRDGYRVTKKLFEKKLPRATKILISVMSDALAIGCSRAVKDLGLGKQAVIVGHGGARDGRNSLRQGGPLKALVAYFPETYGERVIALALRILGGEKVPLITYTNHILLTSANLDQYYPAPK